MKSLFLIYFLTYISNVYCVNTNYTSLIKAAAMRSVLYWENASVPYVVERSQFSQEQVNFILHTLATFEYLTCIKFEPVMGDPPADRHIMVFENPEGVRRCSVSTRGHKVGHRHNIVVGYNCLQQGPHLYQLIMKALGFPFEHSRMTRDLYVIVQIQNVEPDAIELFTKSHNKVLPRALRDIPYDVDSVMHFGEFDYSKNGHRTIIFKNNIVQNRKQLSEYDIKKISAVYDEACKERDRRQKLELCQSFPGKRRKRDTQGGRRSLRINPNITPPKSTDLLQRSTPFEFPKTENTKTRRSDYRREAKDESTEESSGTDDRASVSIEEEEPKVRHKQVTKRDEDITNSADSNENKQVKQATKHLSMYAKEVKSDTDRDKPKEEKKNKKRQRVEESSKEEERQKEEEQEVVFKHKKPKKNTDRDTIPIPKKKKQKIVKETKHETQDEETNASVEKEYASDREVSKPPKHKNKDDTSDREVSKPSKNKNKKPEIAKKEELSSQSDPNETIEKPAENIGIKQFHPDKVETFDFSGEKVRQQNRFKKLQPKPLDLGGASELTMKSKKKKTMQMVRDEILNQSQDEDSEPAPKKSSKKEKIRDDRSEELKVAKIDKGKHKIKASVSSEDESFGDTVKEVIVSVDEDESRDYKKKEMKPTTQKKKARSSEKLQYVPVEISEDPNGGQNDELKTPGSNEMVGRTVPLSKANEDFYNERKWPGGILRIILSPVPGYDLTDLKARLEEVVNIIHKKTCVQVAFLTEKEAEGFEDYVVIDGSADYITGRTGGRQIFGALELFKGGQHRQHAAMMVMAMLGFYFEVSRHDRDKYIRVHNRHIRPDKLHHFEKIREDATLNLPYDYKSATHPAWQFWRKLGKTGISTVATFKDKDPGGIIMRNLGQHDEILSPTDLIKINSVYGVKCFKKSRY